MNHIRVKREMRLEARSEIEWELTEEPNVQVKVIMQRLQQRHLGQFPDHQIRTLQRRVRDWRLQRMKESVGVVEPSFEERLSFPCKINLSRET